MCKLNEGNSKVEAKKDGKKSIFDCAGQCRSRRGARRREV